MQYLPGDVLAFKHGTMYAKFIRLIQGNQYTHCAVVIEPGDRNTARVTEIDSSFGARIVPMSVSESEGKADVFRNQKYMFDGYLIYKDAYYMQGKKYTYALILQSCMNHLIGRALGFVGISYTYRNFFPGVDKVICSTLVSLLLSRSCLDYTFNPTSEPDEYCVGNWGLLPE